MHKHFLISLWLLFFFTAAEAQEKKEVYADTAVEEQQYENEGIKVSNDTIYVDTTLYFKQLVIAEDSVNAWKNSTTFAYVKSLDSLLKTKKDKPVKEAKEYTPPETNWLEKLFAAKGLQVFFWAVAIFFVLFILYKLFLTEGVFRRNTASAKNNTPDAEEEVITPESDLQALIRQAVQMGNYRLAVRYQYLQTLHKLAAKNLVELAADKTNYQYVREISNAGYQNDFAALTLNYEYVWYGEFAIEETVYKKIESGFSQFNSKL